MRDAMRDMLTLMMSDYYLVDHEVLEEKND